MSETPSARHNRLATEFVQLAGREAATFEELMIIMETTMLSGMLLLVKQHKMKPTAASHMMEAALQRATERYGEVMG